MEPLRADTVPADLIDEHGPLPVEPALDMFERLVVAFINQQIAAESAAAIRDGVFDRFAVTPDAVLAADDAALRDTGLSRRRIENITGSSGGV